MTAGALPHEMRVPRFAGEGRIEFATKPVPLPGPGELLLRVGANALCGSERGQFLHGTAVTPGHETAGTVIAAGPGTRTPVGTPGVVFLMDFCGDCRSCRQGFTNQCLGKRADMGFNRDGGYAPYELVSERIFFPVGPDLPLTEATLLLDIMGTGGHAIARAQAVRPDIESLLVLGAGPIGLGVLAMAKLLLGADLPVLISDFSDYRLALAETLGGKPIRLPSTALTDGLQASGMERVDVVIDTSGSSQARQEGVRVLNPRGALVCVGHGGNMSLDVSADLIHPERAVLGSEYFRYDELPANLERLRAHRSYLNQIITHRFDVQDIQQAFETFFAGATGKVVVAQPDEPQ